MFARSASLVGVAILMAACGGASNRNDGPPAEAGGNGTAASGGNTENGGASGISGTSGGGSASGGTSGNGGTSASGGLSGSAGTAGSVGGVAGAYNAFLTNVTDCCDYYTISRADPASNTCVFFKVAVQTAGSVTIPSFAAAVAGIEHCCPSDSLFPFVCDGSMGCRKTTSIMGAISIDAAGFDIDLALQFEPESWLPASIDFRTQDLGRAMCVVPLRSESD